MDKPEISLEKEQDWIRKYRAALDAPAGTESRLQGFSGLLGKAVGMLRAGLDAIRRTASAAKAAATAPAPGEDAETQAMSAPVQPIGQLTKKRRPQKLRVVEQRNEDKAS